MVHSPSQDDIEGEPSHGTIYKQAIGSLMYPMVGTKSDLAYMASEKRVVNNVKKDVLIC